jgi:hypothetical protein
MKKILLVVLSSQLAGCATLLTAGDSVCQHRDQLWIAAQVALESDKPNVVKSAKVLITSLELCPPTALTAGVI